MRDFCPGETENIEWTKGKLIGKGAFGKVSSVTRNACAYVTGRKGFAYLNETGLWRDEHEDRCNYGGQASKMQTQNLARKYRTRESGTCWHTVKVYLLASENQGKRITLSKHHAANI